MRRPSITASRYTSIQTPSKELLSQQGTETTSRRAAPRRRINKSSKKKRGGGEGAAPDTLAIKKVKVWWCTFSKGSAPLSFSDVAGAFDRIKSELLVLKFQSHGIHSRMIEVIRSWLQRRRAAVVVGGGRSAEFSIENQVFRGTVKGPIL